MLPSKSLYLNFLKTSTILILFTILITIPNPAYAGCAWWQILFGLCSPPPAQETTSPESNDSTSTACQQTDDAYENPIEKRFSLSASSNALEILTFTNRDYDCNQDDITNVVIVIHGSSRTAESYFKSAIRSGEESGDQLTKTLVIAPKFFIKSDKDGNSKSIFWTKNGYWKIGHKSDRFLGKRYSSFEVIDKIIDHLSDGDLFPNLETIRVAGHSAGGQFVNRYAAGNLIEENLFNETGIEMSYIVANPSSYVYLNNQRCLNGDDTGCLEFGTYSTSTCRKYDYYKYGTRNLNSYMRKAGTNSIRANYPERYVHYILGENDNFNDGSMATGCQAMAQGEHRLQRGQFYFDFMTEYYPHHIHSFSVVPDVGHSSRGMFTSAIGQCLLFDYQCDE